MYYIVRKKLRVNRESKRSKEGGKLNIRINK